MTQYFKQLNFSPAQLQAMREMILEHFSDVNANIDDDFFVATTTVTWSQDRYDKILSIVQDEKMRGSKFVKLNLAMANDSRWNVFNDLTTIMGTSGSIVLMPPGHKMRIHKDHKARPHAIYFPIFGSTTEVISRFYTTQQVDDGTAYPQFLHGVEGVEVSRFNEDPHFAHIINVREFYDCQNNSAELNMAFGWNFKDSSMTYDQCLDILKSLGYCE